MCYCENIGRFDHTDGMYLIDIRDAFQICLLIITDIRDAFQMCLLIITNIRDAFSNVSFDHYLWYIKNCYTY